MSFSSFLHRIVARPKSWARSAFHRDRLEREMDAELAHHLDRLTADLVRVGFAPEDAARRARIELGAALALTRLVKAMLYGIETNDPMTMIAGVLILLAVALAASWIPARRAARVQPMEALRHE